MIKSDARVRRTAVLLLGLAGLTGCDQVFALELAAGRARDGGTGSGTAGCIPTAFTEPFEDVAVGSDGCLPWGNAGGSGATPTREAGPLVAFEPGGVFVEHERVLALASTYTTLTVRWADGARELAFTEVGSLRGLPRRAGQSPVELRPRVHRALPPARGPRCVWQHPRTARRRSPRQPRGTTIARPAGASTAYA